MSRVARGAVVAGAALLLAVATGPAPAWAQGLCEHMLIRGGEKVHSTGTTCLVDFTAPETTVRVMLDRYDSIDACVSVGQKRREVSIDEPRGRVEELGTRYGADGYEMASPQYAVEHMEGETRVVDIHPAKFDLLFCRPPYRFYAYSMYTPKDAPAVPVEIVEDIRERARFTADRLAGTASGEPAGYGVFEGLAPTVREALRELLQRGLVDQEQADLLMAGIRHNPELDALKARFSRHFGGREPRLDELSANQREVIETVAGAVLLSMIELPDGSPAFPGVSANVEILTRLGETALGSDPARAHQARTAMVRYAGALRALDVGSLDARTPEDEGRETS